MAGATMPLIAPTFIQSDEIDSQITVVNSIILSVPANIVIRDQNGTVTGKLAKILLPHSSTVIPLSALLTEAGIAMHSGSIEIIQDPTVKGPALLAQLSMVLHVGSNTSYLEEEFGMPTMHGSTELRGVASQTGNLPLIAITSISDVSQQISASCLGQTQQPKSIELSAHATLLFTACEWEPIKDDALAVTTMSLQHATGMPVDYGIKLTTDSVPGSFYAFGFTLNGSLGSTQLQPVDFYDPGAMNSSSIAYVGVPVGTQSNPLRGSYSVRASLANFSRQNRLANIHLSYTSSGIVGLADVARIVLPPLSTTTFLVPPNARSGLLNTFTIDSDGAPGDVQAHLFANRDSSEDRIEMLPKDARDDHNGGNHPWSLENGDSSTLLLFNPTAFVQIWFSR